MDRTPLVTSYRQSPTLLSLAQRLYNSLTEDTKDSAIRELEEETGYKCNDISLLLKLRTTVAFCDEMVDVYLAKNLVAGEQKLDDSESIEIEIYTIEELCNMVYEGTIQDSKTVAAIMAYSNKIKNE